jgi:uncharacterized protein YjbI with pentapeptide repeats
MHKYPKQQTAQLSPPFESTLAVQEQKEVEVDWIGFSNKTMWDWLLLFSTLAIPLVVLCATIIFSIQQERMSDAQHMNEMKIAEANRQNDLKMAHDQDEENTLAAYLDGLTTLLLDDRLGSQGAPYDASVVARAKTMIVLRRLDDPQRKSMVVQFLYEAHLITGKQPRVSLAGADLSDVDLSNIDLKNINLSGAHLNKALLLNTNLSGATLSYADMRGADMQGANMQGADMQGTIITQVPLQPGRLHQRVLAYQRLIRTDN